MIFNELEEIFQDASKSYGVANLSGEGYRAYMKLGIKITRDDETGEVTIYDPSKGGGSYYVEINEDQYQLFFDHGWEEAVKRITLYKYSYQIDRLTESIKNEMNAVKCNEKSLLTYKLTKNNILKKYFKLTNKHYE